MTLRIRFTKEVVFSDREGNVLKTYEIDSYEAASAYDEKRGIFVIAMGGIYDNEAEIVEKDDFFINKNGYLVNS